MRDDNRYDDSEYQMEDPVWRLLNGIDRPSDRWRYQPTSKQEPPNVLAIICIGVVPPLILLVYHFLF